MSTNPVSRRRSRNDDLVFTRHAQQRMTERRITETMVFIAIGYGSQYGARNGIAYYMDAQSVATAARDGFCTANCTGVAVIVKEECVVITVERVSETPSFLKWCGL